MCVEEAGRGQRGKRQEVRSRGRTGCVKGPVVLGRRAFTEGEVREAFLPAASRGRTTGRRLDFSPGKAKQSGETNANDTSKSIIPKCFRIEA